MNGLKRQGSSGSRSLLKSSRHSSGGGGSSHSRSTSTGSSHARDRLLVSPGRMRKSGSCRSLTIQAQLEQEDYSSDSSSQSAGESESENVNQQEAEEELPFVKGLSDLMDMDDLQLLQPDNANVNANAMEATSFQVGPTGGEATEAIGHQQQQQGRHKTNSSLQVTTTAANNHQNLPKLDFFLSKQQPQNAQGATSSSTKRRSNSSSKSLPGFFASSNKQPQNSTDGSSQLLRHPCKRSLSSTKLNIVDQELIDQNGEIHEHNDNENDNDSITSNSSDNDSDSDDSDSDQSGHSLGSITSVLSKRSIASSRASARRSGRRHKKVLVTSSFSDDDDEDDDTDTASVVSMRRRANSRRGLSVQSRNRHNDVDDDGDQASTYSSRSTRSGFRRGQQRPLVRRVLSDSRNSSVRRSLSDEQEAANRRRSSSNHERFQRQLQQRSRSSSVRRSRIASEADTTIHQHHEEYPNHETDNLKQRRSGGSSGQNRIQALPPSDQEEPTENHNRELESSTTTSGTNSSIGKRPKISSAQVLKRANSGRRRELASEKRRSTRSGGDRSIRGGRRKSPVPDHDWTKSAHKVNDEISNTAGGQPPRRRSGNKLQSQKTQPDHDWAANIYKPHVSSTTSGKKRIKKSSRTKDMKKHGSAQPASGQTEKCSPDPSPKRSSTFTGILTLAARDDSNIQDEGIQHALSVANVTGNDGNRRRSLNEPIYKEANAPFRRAATHDGVVAAAEIVGDKPGISVVRHPTTIRALDDSDTHTENARMPVRKRDGEREKSPTGIRRVSSYSGVLGRARKNSSRSYLQRSSLNKDNHNQATPTKNSAWHAQPAANNGLRRNANNLPSLLSNIVSDESGQESDIDLLDDASSMEFSPLGMKRSLSTGAHLGMTSTGKSAFSKKSVHELVSLKKTERGDQPGAVMKSTTNRKQFKEKTQRSLSASDTDNHGARYQDSGSDKVVARTKISKPERERIHKMLLHQPGDGKSGMQRTTSTGTMKLASAGFDCNKRKSGRRKLSVSRHQTEKEYSDDAEDSGKDQDASQIQRNPAERRFIAASKGNNVLRPSCSAGALGLLISPSAAEPTVRSLNSENRKTQDNKAQRKASSRVHKTTSAGALGLIITEGNATTKPQSRKHEKDAFGSKFDTWLKDKNHSGSPSLTMNDKRPMLNETFQPSEKKKYACQKYQNAMVAQWIAAQPGP
ncbi:expressed unknown protein [Seminavis robusta]|uniref:Uncharacterized protein n=1 Tax=Seminavis robusta TaxID=568900 RepID=A0A9N8HSR1_9STRA|nr:expressed unknown protein [Seminavis robusta]|eukprot:Sro1761_g295930.1 n/a (1195) ;mRNA; r:12012-15682